MYIGIDLGTSGVKVVLTNDSGKVIASANESLSISNPQPLWSEQDPNAWFAAIDKAMLNLGTQASLQSVTAIGLTGQMHGAVLLDNENQVLRPAILWNDGRSYAECMELEEQVPSSRLITGSLMVPGATAPKLKWVEKNEPEIFKQIDKVLLPKDYIRFLITGEYASDMSDASGTMWLDVAKRNWSDAMLNACNLSKSNMPQLFEGTQITGILLKKYAKSWQIREIPVVAGGGDNAAGAVGVGLHKHGQAMLSLGTSGVYFMVSDGFLNNSSHAVHSFCHALPDTWHLMSVMLSAASCLEWVRKLTNAANIEDMIRDASLHKPSNESIWFLPYLSGERTPHNNPKAKGTFFGLTSSHERNDLVLAVLKGVSFGLADCMDVLHDSGISPTSITLVGGGAKNHFWRQMLSDVSGYELQYCTYGDVGPALGAARLAQIATQKTYILSELLKPLPVEQIYSPKSDMQQQYLEERKIFRQLYRSLLPLMT